MNVSDKILVCIATSKGPSLVMDLASNQRMKDGDRPRSGLVLARELGYGVNDKVEISSAYSAFCHGEQGVIDKLFKEDSYKLTLSRTISDGESWQLGVASAHILFSNNKLFCHTDNPFLLELFGYKSLGLDKSPTKATDNNERPAKLLWLTGKVIPGKNNILEVWQIEHEKEKIEKSTPLFEMLDQYKIDYTLYFPTASQHVVQSLSQNFAMERIKYINKLDEIDELKIENKKENNKQPNEIIKKLKEKSSFGWRILKTFITIASLGLVIGLLNYCSRPVYPLDISLKKYDAISGYGCPVGKRSDESIAKLLASGQNVPSTDRDFGQISPDTTCWLSFHVVIKNGEKQFVGLLVRHENEKQFSFAAVSDAIKESNTWTINTRDVKEDESGTPLKQGRYYIYGIKSSSPLTEEQMESIKKDISILEAKLNDTNLFTALLKKDLSIIELADNILARQYIMNFSNP